jgi:hypothetical protein
VNVTAQQPCLAGAAVAAPAAVRQIERGLPRGIEQRLIGGSLEAAAGIGEGNVQLFSR